MPINNAKRWSFVSGIITVISIFMIVIGVILSDVNSYWMIYVGAILGVTFLFFTVIFIRQAKRLERLFKGDELLAHWIFELDDRDKKIQKEFENKKGLHLMMLVVIGTLFLLITGLFVIFGFDDFSDALGFMILMGGIFLVVSAFALITPYISYHKNKKSTPQIFIGPYSVWMMGEYTQWKAPFIKITGIVYGKSEVGNAIEIHLNIYQRFGPQPHLVFIPIPKGKEEEGLRIAQNLSVINSVSFFKEEA